MVYIVILLFECGILLTESHKEALKSPNQWLDDDLINAAQYLLKKHNPSIDGFLLSFKFQMEPKRTPFIQILNINNNRWPWFHYFLC